MQNSATNPFVNFMNPKFQLKEKFGIVMQEEDYIEAAYQIWRKIGNIAIATHCLKEKVDNNGEIALPCNIEFIEAVTTGDIFMNNTDDVVYYFDGSQDVRPVIHEYYLPDILNDTHLNRVSITRTQLHPIGQAVPYEIIGCNKKLKFDDRIKGQSIDIIYRGQVLDNEGLPCLCPKEAEAITYYLAFIRTQYNFFVGDPTAQAKLVYIKQEADIKMAAAKIPEYVTQNFWDQLLSAKVRMDRKVFYNSYKGLQ